MDALVLMFFIIFTIFFFGLILIKMFDVVIHFLAYFIGKRRAVKIRQKISSFVIR